MFHTEQQYKMLEQQLQKMKKEIELKDKENKILKKQNREKDEDCDLDIVPNQGLETTVDYAMSNSLGFGGHNASIIFKKVDTDSAQKGIQS